jgi:hypothetical protein
VYSVARKVPTLTEFSCLSQGRCEVDAARGRSHPQYVLHNKYFGLEVLDKFKEVFIEVAPRIFLQSLSVISPISLPSGTKPLARRAANNDIHRVDTDLFRKLLGSVFTQILLQDVRHTSNIASES